MIRELKRRCRVFVVVLGLVGGLSVPAHANEIWVVPAVQSDLGGPGIGSNVFWPVTVVGAARLAWAIPDNLQTFQGAKLVLIPRAGGAGTLNVFICQAQNADMAGAGCSGPIPHAFVSVANQLLEVDISAAIAPKVGNAGLRYLSVLAYTTPSTQTDHILGLRFAFNPAFVGDGSQLINLPFPAGAATLGANTFSGTQTAPAFVGDGSGLTNIPAGPAGPPGPQGPPGPAGSSVIERPLPVTFDGLSYIIVDVENSADTSTTVRMFNNSGSDIGIRVALFSSVHGGSLAQCEIPVVQNRQTVDWCIHPSDFGGDRFASLGIFPMGYSFPGSVAISAFVRKVTP
jgi:hypothetical protein